MRIFHTLRSFHLREFNRNVQLFFLYGIFINAGMALFSLLYNLYLLRLNYQEDFIGQLAGMAPLATGILALPIGILSDRFGRKPFLVASGLLLAVSQLGLCLATEAIELLVFSFIGGAASAFIWVNHVPFLSDNALPSRRGEALVIWSALQIVIRMVLSLGGGFMPSVMGYFLGSSTTMPEPFRYALLLGAICSLVAILPLLRLQESIQQIVKTKKYEQQDLPVKTYTSPWYVFSGITALSSMRGFAVGLTYPFFNVFFEAELQLSAVSIGFFFFLSQLVSLPATFSAPALVRRFGPTLTIVTTRTIGGIALGIMGFFINLPLAVLMFLFVRISEVIDNPSDQHFSIQVLPRNYWARIQGFRVCGFQLFNFAGSFLGGFLIIDYGYSVAFGLACLARIASGIIMATFFGRKPKND